jgi:hypothetical protein
MEHLLKKTDELFWKVESQNSFNTQDTSVTEPILILLDWNFEFHVHVDSLQISLGFILV